jgi:DNA replication initiation complex subunit (GINS family)
MAPPSEVNRDFVGNRCKLESGSGKLTKLEPSFYQDVERYMRRLQEEFQSEQAANPGSSKSALLLDDINSTRALFEDIYERRERKIVSAALSAARGTSPDLSNMLSREKEFFDLQVQVLRDAKRSVIKGEPLNRPLSPAKEASTAMPAAEQPRPVAQAPVTAASQPPAVNPTAPPVQSVSTNASPGIDSRIVVRVLADVPQFKASDMRTYKLAKEDVVSLPRDAARALSMRGLVQFVTAAATA